MLPSGNQKSDLTRRDDDDGQPSFVVVVVVVVEGVLLSTLALIGFTATLRTLSRGAGASVTHPLAGRLNQALRRIPRSRRPAGGEGGVSLLCG